ncbi:hypothetical protein, partial [Eggerthella lenta]|uniref:hypothetical protein n=1 Tax=Eggerthella lenta TaxID=84112 RepID=UPI001EE290D1
TVWQLSVERRGNRPAIINGKIIYLGNIGAYPANTSFFRVRKFSSKIDLVERLGQFTRNYTQTVKRAADNKRRYAPGEGSIPPVLLSGVSKGVPPLAHDFACKV